MSKKYLWQFEWDCGRSGYVEGLFVATEKEVENAVGKDLYFGEILGKHSEVYGVFEEGEAEKLDVSPEAVEEVSQYLGETWSGYNPLHYIKCPKCGASDPYEIELKNNGHMLCAYCGELDENGHVVQCQPIKELGEDEEG